MTSIDLNCDMGEIPVSVYDGTQEALMAHISSVNIACGGHAGDDQTMEATILQAKRHHLQVGAHPGYPDPANFGRLELGMSLESISEFVHAQVVRLAQISVACGMELKHVKPHGALYNQAVNNAAIAGAIADGVKRWNPKVLLVGLAGSLMLEIFRAEGFRVAGEAFADRRYEADGTLRSRRFADALMRDPEAAADQASRITALRKAQTICIHSDTPGALAIAAAVAARLRGEGLRLAGLV